jgi:hypothetical protein
MQRLLVLACGRSGTRYASKVLRAAGLDVGHEKEGADGMVSWRSVGIESDFRDRSVVWHQVREPLGVVSSFHTVMGRSWRFVSDADHRIPLGDPILVRCMKYWSYWNQECERRAEQTYRVEDLMSLLPLLLRRLGVDVTPEVLGRCSMVPSNDHTRRSGPRQAASYPALSWDDLVAAEPDVAARMRVQAQRYGYEFSK